MPHEYTRQRQGRDFSILNYLANAEIGNNDPKDESEKRKSLLDQLERCKAEAERSAIPVDGYDPPEKGGVRRGL